eukprot:Nitzschia sp. Nitz4//scaffold35_size145790//83973//84755//NITZ4_003033-RA/size145790-processed-gene-0.93-mRNA-1//-1//CDS//3329549133//65//frame0
MRFSLPSLLVLLGPTAVNSWFMGPAFLASRLSSNSMSPLQMALDLSDPDVAAEVERVAALSMDSVESELLDLRIPPDEDFTEQELRDILAESRLRLSGALANGSQEIKNTIPTKFTSKFQETYHTNTIFRKLYQIVERERDTNSMNVMMEYLNNPELAKDRYGEEYKKWLGQIDSALKAKSVLSKPVLEFSGFPLGMGCEGLRDILESAGTIVDLKCREDNANQVLFGRVTFETLDEAQACMETYNGMANMGAVVVVRAA